MSLTQITGQYLIDLANDLLAGYQNGVDSRALLSYLNLGKDVIWAVTKECKDEYFQVFSQATTSTATNYFPQLSLTQRSYTLPEDLREINYIEVVTPAGTPQARFTYAKANSPEFRAEREESNTAGGPLENDYEYLYTIAGKDQFVLAKYPSQPYTLTLWYTSSIADFEAGDIVSDVLFPYSKQLAQYAAKATMLADQDPAQFAQWEKEWREQIIVMTQAAGERNDADPQFVQDFHGGWE